VGLGVSVRAFVVGGASLVAGCDAEGSSEGVE
jgi:hypothetical protein